MNQTRFLGAKIQVFRKRNPIRTQIFQRLKNIAQAIRNVLGHLVFCSKNCIYSVGKIVSDT